MIKKIKEKEKAIKLRKEGLSYREILDIIPVAKSTLSLWLRSVGLSKEQRQRLTEKKLASIRRGAEAKRNQRIAITERIKKDAIKEIDRFRLSKRDLWLIGISLYWAEGSKEKNRGTLAILGNSDPFLIKIYIKWLLEICNISLKDIHFRIYLHETAKDRLQEIISYWSEKTGFPPESFNKVSWKKNKIRIKRKNIGNNYYGLLSVIVKRSTNLNRKISGWIEGIKNIAG